MTTNTVLLLNSETLEPQLPRWTVYPFPEYSYVPGMWPHPAVENDPPWSAVGFRAATGNDCTAYRWGIDLFNGGYFWEAHEAWEAVWKAAGRTLPEARFVQGLIKLAACGVKAREGRGVGVARHAARSLELWRDCGLAGRVAGLELDELQRASDWLIPLAEHVLNTDRSRVVKALPIRLWPHFD